MKAVELMPGVVWHIPVEPPADAPPPVDDTKEVSNGAAIDDYFRRHGKAPSNEQLSRHHAEMDWRRRHRLRIANGG
jgi:hypothetical protein